MNAHIHQLRQQKARMAELAAIRCMSEWLQTKTDRQTSEQVHNDWVSQHTGLHM